MFKLFCKRFFAGLVVCAICLLSIGALGISSSVAEPSLAVDNSAITSCWTGFCGHKGETNTWPSYSVSSKPTCYQSLGLYVEKGGTVSASWSGSSTGGVTAGLTAGSDNAKASIGVSGSFSKSWSLSVSQPNKTNVRQYAHIGAQYEMRGNTVTKVKRTYDPKWDLFGFNNVCKFTTTKTATKGNVVIANGISLLSSVKNDTAVGINWKKIK